jgi:hypothetical protein
MDWRSGYKRRRRSFIDTELQTGALKVAERTGGARSIVILVAPQGSPRILAKNCPVVPWF